MTEGIEVVCTLNCPVTAKQGAAITKALKAAVAEAFPDTTVRGCWVHEGLPKPKG